LPLTRAIIHFLTLLYDILCESMGDNIKVKVETLSEMLN